MNHGWQSAVFEFFILIEQVIVQTSHLVEENMTSHRLCRGDSIIDHSEHKVVIKTVEIGKITC